jgi:hypothetical protein
VEKEVRGALEVGDEVELIRAFSSGYTHAKEGDRGKVTSGIRGGFCISLEKSPGDLRKMQIVVGSIDWHIYIKKLKRKTKTTSSAFVPLVLRSWYEQTERYIK